MLHKSFKPAKCKTSLKLAISRIKLMKNKKGVQINQMKRDLSQLLDTAQDRTARIRVEHVIREEKMIAAYELIEIYCELIVARLPIIESQKTCPIDLKEAVTSVIFAAPRCSDISELSDIRKHFTKKYGKEFVSAALELRPDCGVSRLLVEKLSAIAPDVQTKIKVLSDVAKEHNVKWDPTLFEEKESNPPNDDLLNGPSGFEKISMAATVDPPKIQAPNVDVMHSHKEKKDAPIDFSQQNRKYTLDAPNTTSTDTVGVDTRSSGATSERMEMRQPVGRGKDDFSSGRENWNMEFKDATSAAQAAAESAERAAMAARAAAQFSRDKRHQYPTGSHVSDIRHEPSRVSTPSGFIEKDPSRDSNESSSNDRKPKILNQQTNQSEHGTSQEATGNTRSSRPTSFGSDDDSVEDEKLVNNFHMADGYFEESLNQDQDQDQEPPHLKKTTLEGFQESKTEVGSNKKESLESEDINNFAEESTGVVEVPENREFAKTSVVGNPFEVFDKRNLFSEATKTSSNLDSRKDDDDDDGPRFDTGFEYDEVEEKSYFSENNQMNFQSPLFSESISFPDHSVKDTEPLETDDQNLASFDHSDSESETDVFSTNPEPLSTQDFNSRKTRIELNDLVERESSLNNEDQESVGGTLEGGNNDSLNQSNDFNSLNFGTLTGGLRNKGGLRHPPVTKTPPTDVSRKLVEESSRTEDKRPNVSISDSDSDDYKFPVEFSSEKANNRSRYPSSAAFFGDDGTDSEEEEVVGSKLASSRVGLGSGISRRTKRPPYSKSHVESEPRRPSYSKSHVESEPLSPPYSKSHVEAEPTIPSYSKSHVEAEPTRPSYSKSHVEAEPTRPSYSKSHVEAEPTRPSYSKSHVEAEPTRPSYSKSHVRAEPISPLYSKSHVESEPLTHPYSKSHVEAEPTRPYSKSHVEAERTKPPYSKSHVEAEPTRPPYSNSHVEAEPISLVSSSIEHRKPSRYSYSDEVPDEPHQTKTTGGSPLVPHSKSRVEPKTVISSSDEASLPVKKGSHVHPKLPDYDLIAARFESLRTRRQ